MGGFQLWVNLPRSNKMMDPRYQEVTHEQIPTVTPQYGVTIQVIAGSAGGTTDPVRDIVADPCYLDVTLGPASTFSQPAKEGCTALAYVVTGEGTFDTGKDTARSTVTLCCVVTDRRSGRMLLQRV